MSAGCRIISVRVDAAPFDVAAETARLTADLSDIGAVVTFTGLCRAEDDRLAALELEHYPGMAEAEIARVAEEAGGRFPLDAIGVVHRFGVIRPGEAIVLVTACSRHRDAAFDGARFVMDYLKSRAPFWKKEHRRDGSEGNWVDARESDAAALQRWNGAG